MENNRKKKKKRGKKWKKKKKQNKKRRKASLRNCRILLLRIFPSLSAFLVREKVQDLKETLMESEWKVRKERDGEWEEGRQRGKWRKMVIIVVKKGKKIGKKSIGWGKKGADRVFPDGAPLNVSCVNYISFYYHVKEFWRKILVNFFVNNGFFHATIWNKELSNLNMN